MTRGLELGRNEMDIATFRSCILFTPRKTMISFLLLSFWIAVFLNGPKCRSEKGRSETDQVVFLVTCGERIRGGRLDAGTLDRTLQR